MSDHVAPAGTPLPPSEEDKPSTLPAESTTGQETLPSSPEPQTTEPPTEEGLPPPVEPQVPTTPGVASAATGTAEPAEHPAQEEMPETAQKISGKTYFFDSNPGNFKRISLDFKSKKDEVMFSLSFRDRDLQVPVGLDNVYRLTKATGYLRAYRGSWEDDVTFVIDYQIVDYSESGKISLAFEEDKVTFVLREWVNGSTRKITARLKE